MKCIMKIVAAIALTFASLAVSAQTTKIGYFDMQAVMKTLPDVANAEKTFQAKAAEMQKEAEALQKQLQTMFQEYQANESTYSETMKKTKNEELMQLNERVTRYQQIAQQELQNQEQQLMQPIIEKIMNAVKEVGKENGFTMIVEKNGVLYLGTGTVDIVPLVKKKLGVQ